MSGSALSLAVSNLNSPLFRRFNGRAILEHDGRNFELGLRLAKIRIPELHVAINKLIDAVIDLYSRQIVGWATQSTMTCDLVLHAQLKAAWKRRPGPGVLVHSDQSSQFTSEDWRSLLKAHHMMPSMNRRGNCHGNAVAESFHCELKMERIKRRI